MTRPAPGDRAGTGAVPPPVGVTAPIPACGAGQRGRPPATHRAVRRVQGRQRLDRPERLSHSRTGRVRDPVLEQLRTCPAPGEDRLKSVAGLTSWSRCSPGWRAGSLGLICGGECGTTSAVCWGGQHARTAGSSLNGRVRPLLGGGHQRVEGGVVQALGARSRGGIAAETLRGPRVGSAGLKAGCLTSAARRRPRAPRLGPKPLRAPSGLRRRPSAGHGRR